MDLGNTAQFAAHALLEYYSVSLPKKVSARRQPYLAFLSNLTKNLTSQSAHLNYAVLPLFCFYHTKKTRFCLLPITRQSRNSCAMHHSLRSKFMLRRQPFIPVSNLSSFSGV
jgi:hypothetical protein